MQLQDIMDVRARCLRLLMTIMILLGAQEQLADAVSLSIAPKRSQFFEYESVTFYCEGVNYCQIVHKFKGKFESCNNTNKKTPTGSSCSINNVYTEESGEYWSETEGGERSKSINITVTNGSVILEVPAVPVMEGQTVTLHCRNKIASSNLTADFYKDGHHIHRSSKGNMNIYRVSKSDEGLYKCRISGAGDSPESWLKVTDSATDPDVHTEESRSSSAATPWIIATILLSALLMAAVGLYRYGKGCWVRGAALLCQSEGEGSGSAEDQTEANTVTYASVRTISKKKEDEGGLSSGPIYYNLDQSDTQQQEQNQELSQSLLYTTVACRARADRTR